MVRKSGIGACLLILFLLMGSVTAEPDSDSESNHDSVISWTDCEPMFEISTTPPFIRPNEACHFQDRGAEE